MRSELEVDSVLEGLTTQELKDVVVKNVEEINRLKEEAKAFSKGTRETIKYLDSRNKEAIQLMDEYSKQKSESSFV
jgi:hypothetical protein